MIEMFLIFVILLIVFYKTGILKGAFLEGKNSYKEGYSSRKRARASFEVVSMIITVPFIIIIFWIVIPYIANSYEEESKIMEPFIGRYAGFIEIDNYVTLILKNKYYCIILDEKDRYDDCSWSIDKDIITLTLSKNNREFKYQGKKVDDGILIDNNLLIKYE